MLSEHGKLMINLDWIKKRLLLELKFEKNSMELEC